MARVSHAISDYKHYCLTSQDTNSDQDVYINAVVIGCIGILATNTTAKTIVGITSESNKLVSKHIT